MLQKISIMILIGVIILLHGIKSDKGNLKLNDIIILPKYIYNKRSISSLIFYHACTSYIS